MGKKSNSGNHREEILQYFKLAVENSSDAIGMSTPEGKHWYQNKAFDDLFGDIGDDPPSSVFVDEKVGRKVFYDPEKEIFPNDPEANKYLSRPMRGEWKV